VVEPVETLSDTPQSHSSQGRFETPRGKTSLGDDDINHGIVLEINMKSLQENMAELRKQLKKGAIQKAYQGLMEYMLSLKNHFSNKYPDYSTPGSLYNGYMDMTYFSILSKSLKDRDLKIAIVFLYDAFRFEIWLSGKNKQVLAKYWKIIDKSGWDKYKVVEPVKGVDSIVEHILVDNPDFSDLDTLTKQIEQRALEFIQDIEDFLSQTAT
jgi:hypothetical protein